MKKIFQKINTKKSRSVVFGLVLTFMLTAGISVVQAQNSSTIGGTLDNIGDIANSVLFHRAQNVKPFLADSTEPLWRIGSLGIGGSVPELTFDSGYLNCILTDNNNGSQESCLSVTGLATFFNVISKQPSYFLSSLIVSDDPNVGNLSASHALEIQEPIGGLGLMVSSLGYTDATGFAPRDLVTQSHVCAEMDGTMVRCDNGTVTTTETYSWIESGFGACSPAATADQCTGSYTTTTSGYTPPSVYSSCFIADTYVTMADGTKKPIQDVRIGDVLKGETGNNTVLAFHRPLLGDKLLYSYNGGEYFVTAEHPFMTTEGWKAFNPELAVIEHNLDIEIGQLAVGDTLITEDGYVVLETVDTQSDAADTQLYNFVLDGDNTYYADGYLVHNKWEPCTATDGSNNCPNSGQLCIDYYTDLALANGNGQCSFNCTPGQTWPGGSAYCPTGYTAGMFCDSNGQRKCIKDGESFPTSGGTVTRSCGSFLSSGPGNEEIDCESQDPACTWVPGNGAGPSVATQTVHCEDSSGTVVADQLCIDNVGPKPAETTTDGCGGTGTPFTCTSSGWSIEGFEDTCGPTDYDPFNLYKPGDDMCAPNGTLPPSNQCPGGGSSTGSAVPGATVWYCHLGSFNEQVGTTCDNENFPAGYMWGQQRVCTTATPTDAMCESGPITSPSTADCTYSGSGTLWNCTD